jgi:hypothetical protein
MHPDHTIGSLGGRSNTGDGDGRGVTGKDRLFRSYLIELLKYLPFQRNILDSGFNDKIAVLEVLHLDGCGKPLKDGLLFIGRHLSFLDPLIEICDDSQSSFLNCLHGYISHQDMKPGGQGRLCNPAAHLPCTHHTHYLDLHFENSFLKPKEAFSDAFQSPEKSLLPSLYKRSRFCGIWQRGVRGDFRENMPNQLRTS